MLTEHDHPLELTMLAEDVDKVVLEAQLFSADEGPVRRDMSPEKYLYVTLYEDHVHQGASDISEAFGEARCSSPLHQGTMLVITQATLPARIKGSMATLIGKPAEE